MSQPPDIIFTISTEPTVARAENISGEHSLSAVSVVSFGHQPEVVFLEFYGPYGQQLRGGLRLPISTLDQIAREWLAARGSLPKEAEV